MGKDGIAEMVKLLCARDLNGIFIVRDADEKPEVAFKEATGAFCNQFNPPKNAFTIEKGRRNAGVFLLPGAGKTGTLEHLLLEAVNASHPEVIGCVDAFHKCSKRTTDWSSNKKAKMKMHCVVAAYCKDDPGCSLGFIWHKGEDNPLDISSPAFKELSDFLSAISTT